MKLRLSIRFLLLVVVCSSFFMAGWLLPFPVFQRASELPTPAASPVKQRVAGEIGIIQVQGRRVLVNQGSDDGIRKQDEIAIYKNGTRFGVASVVAITPNNSVALMKGDMIPSSEDSAYKLPRR